MSTDLRLTDEPYDLAIVDGDLQLVDGREEVIQAVTIAVLAIQGEWEYDFTNGIPWLVDMFDINYPQVRKEAHLKDAILKVENVLSVDRLIYTVDPVNKGAYVAFEARTTFGPITVEIGA